MTSRLALLALEKDVLVARASLQRLQIAREAIALGDSLRSPRAWLGAGSPARAALFGALLLAAGRRRLPRWLRIAAAALAVARLALPRKSGVDARQAAPGERE